MWTLVIIGVGTVGATIFAYKYVIAAPEQLALLLDRWYLGCLPMMATPPMLGFLLCPAFYSKHRSALHAAHNLIIIASFSHAHVLLLWHRRLGGPGAGTLTHRAQYFACESFFGCLVWLLALAFPVGHVSDLALATLFLAAALAGNPSVCSATSRMRYGALVTMSPGPLRVVETVTGWILRTPEGTPGTVAGAAPPRVVTCPLALAFWQVSRSM